MRSKVWQNSPKRVVIYDKNLAKIDTILVTLTESCHIQNMNQKKTKLYRLFYCQSFESCNIMKLCRTNILIAEDWLVFMRG